VGILFLLLPMDSNRGGGGRVDGKEWLGTCFLYGDGDRDGDYREGGVSMQVSA
jgi:hypothetical protein